MKQSHKNFDIILLERLSLVGCLYLALFKKKRIWHTISMKITVSEVSCLF